MREELFERAVKVRVVDELVIVCHAHTCAAAAVAAAAARGRARHARELADDEEHAHEHLNARAVAKHLLDERRPQPAALRATHAP